MDWKQADCIKAKLEREPTTQNMLRWLNYFSSHSFSPRPPLCLSLSVCLSVCHRCVWFHLVANYNSARDLQSSAYSPALGSGLFPLRDSPRMSKGKIPISKHKNNSLVDQLPNLLIDIFANPRICNLILFSICTLYRLSLCTVSSYYCNFVQLFFYLCSKY